MDFVVAGLGFGALLVVIGYAVRDLGPSLWRSSPSIPDDLKAGIHIQRVALCKAVGNAFAFAGSAVLLITVIAIAAGVPDSTGTLIITIAILVGIVCAAAMTLLAARNLQPVDIPRAHSTRSSLHSAPAVTLPSGAVRRLPRTVEPGPVAAKADNVDHDAEIAAFNPNRLLASELDHDDTGEYDHLLPPFPAEEPIKPTVASETAQDQPIVEAPDDAEVAASSPYRSTDAGDVEMEQVISASEPEQVVNDSTDGHDQSESTAPVAPLEETLIGTDEVLSVVVRLPDPPVELSASKEDSASDEPTPVGDDLVPAPIEPAVERAVAAPAADSASVFESKLLADILPGGVDGMGSVPTGAASGSAFQSSLLRDIAAPMSSGSNATSPVTESDDLQTEDGKRRSLFARRGHRP